MSTLEELKKLKKEIEKRIEFEQKLQYVGCPCPPEEPLRAGCFSVAYTQDSYGRYAWALRMAVIYPTTKGFKYITLERCQDRKDIAKSLPNIIKSLTALKTMFDEESTWIPVEQ